MIALSHRAKHVLAKITKSPANSDHFSSIYMCAAAEPGTCLLHTTLRCVHLRPHRAIQCFNALAQLDGSVHVTRESQNIKKHPYVQHPPRLILSLVATVVVGGYTIAEVAQGYSSAAEYLLYILGKAYIGSG